MQSESQNVEYKESWRDEYLKWICGFANAHGGRLCGVVGKRLQEDCRRIQSSRNEDADN